MASINDQQNVNDKSHIAIKLININGTHPSTNAQNLDSMKTRLWWYRLLGKNNDSKSSIQWWIYTCILGVSI